MASASSEVRDHLATLPDDRRKLVSTVRDVIRAHLPDGIEEAMANGMIVYQLPLERLAPTSNGEPLQAAALANHERHLSLCLTGADADELATFRTAWTATGKPLDMDDSCVRFRRREDVPLVVVGDAITRIGPEELIAAHERTQA